MAPRGAPLSFMNTESMEMNGAIRISTWMLWAAIELDLNFVNGMAEIHRNSLHSVAILWHLQQHTKPLWWPNSLPLSLSQWQWLIRTISLSLFFIHTYHTDEINYIDIMQFIIRIAYKLYGVFFIVGVQQPSLNPAYQLNGNKFDNNMIINIRIDSGYACMVRCLVCRNRQYEKNIGLSSLFI